MLKTITSPIPYNKEMDSSRARFPNPIPLNGPIVPANFKLNRNYRSIKAQMLKRLSVKTVPKIVWPAKIIESKNCKILKVQIRSEFGLMKKI